MIATSTTDVPEALRRAAGALPPYLTEAQRLRLARIRAGRDLFHGRWRKFLLAEGRTAHLFKAIANATGRERPLLVTVNVIGLAARKTADLLMLDPPGVTADDAYPVQQDAIDAINQASHIEAVLYEAALTACYEAEAWLQVQRFGGRTIIANVAADLCFPVGDQQPDGTYATVEKIWILSRGAGREKRSWLRKESHAAGSIANELWRIDAYGRLEARVDLAEAYGAEAPPDRIDTGVDEILLDFVPNFTVGNEPVSDFDGVDELVDQFTAAVSQVAGVVARHADPKMRLPMDSADAGGEAAGEPSGRVRAADDAYYTDDPADKPEYITWQAQLEPALKAVDNWLEWLMVVTETSPALCGLRKGGSAPEAWRKLRLEAANTLAKVARKKLYWDRFLKDRYRVAHKLDNAAPGVRYDFGPVGVAWHDGIPLDETEEAEGIATQRQAGVIDRRTAVEDLHGPEKGERVNERLDAEEAERSRMTMNLAERVLPPEEGAMA